MDRFIPIAKVELSDDEIQAAVDVLKSGRLIQGERTKELEEAFAGFVGAQHAIAVSSGTAALHIAYLATIEPGDDVLVPTFSHISTASMVHFAGGRPVFCDIDPQTFTLDLESAQSHLTDKTTAIVPVHLFGNACPIDETVAFARANDLTLIWDAAQAHGTRYRNADVGSFDDLVCYSFYPTKNMFTGEGGMITTNDADLAERCRLLRAHGQTQKYYHPTLGLNYRMTDVEAAIGLHQVQKLGDLIKRRRDNAAFLTDHLAQVDGVTPPEVPDHVEHAYHQYSVLLDVERLNGSRDQFAATLREAGVGTGVHYPRPIHKQPAFEELVGASALPTSERICDRILSLPVHPGLDRQDCETIVEAVRHAAAQHLQPA